MSQAMLDTGTAYDMKPPSYRAELTEVGRGTPMGELLRRYWHPVGTAADAGSIPKEVRVLGEDLILFRDGEGKPGLVHSRCCHRGTTLYYGKVEDRGIRCCYHGWLFDTQGHCLEMPCEPEMGARMKDRVRQPWYPVEERYGLIFAYMGPPDKKPVLPRYETLENVGEDEELITDDTSIGGGGPVIIDCNWLQNWENVLDPFHVPILHGTFSGTQFTPAMNAMPYGVEFVETPRGVEQRTTRTLPDGRILNRKSEAIFPTARSIASVLLERLDVPSRAIGWNVPIDDTHYRLYTAARVEKGGGLLKAKGVKNRTKQDWIDMSLEERRAKPGDYEAQMGQGPITFHSEEHLVTSDKGIVVLRRQMYKQLQAIERGEDPINLSFDPDAPPIRLSAGNWLAKDEPAMADAE